MKRYLTIFRSIAFFMFILGYHGTIGGHGDRYGVGGGIATTHGIDAAHGGGAVVIIIPGNSRLCHNDKKFNDKKFAVEAEPSRMSVCN